MPQPLQQVNSPDDNTSNWLNAAKTGAYIGQTLRENALADQKRAAFQQAGNAYASGDWQGMRNALAGGGYLDEAKVAQGWQNEDQDRAAKQQALSAYAANDPQGALVNAAKSADWQTFSAIHKMNSEDQAKKLEEAKQGHEFLYNLTDKVEVPGNPDLTAKNFQDALAAAELHGADTSKERMIAQSQGIPTALNYVKAQLGNSDFAVKQEAQKQKDQQGALNQFSTGLSLFQGKDDEKTAKNKRGFIQSYMKTGKIPGLDLTLDENGDFRPGAEEAWLSRGPGAKDVYKTDNAPEKGSGRLSAAEGAWKVAQEQAEKTGRDPYEIFKANTGVAYKDAMVDQGQQRIANTDFYNRGKLEQQSKRDQNIANAATARLTQKATESDRKAIAETAFQYMDDPDSWISDGIPMLKAQGFNVDGLDSKAGLKAAVGMGGLGAKAVSSDQAAEKIDQADRAQTERERSALIREGISQQNAYTASNRQADLEAFHQREKNDYDAANRTIEERKTANEADGGNRPTDYDTVLGEIRAKKGGYRWSATQQATENAILGYLNRHPDAKREDVPPDVAQSAGFSHGVLDKNENGDWIVKNPTGSKGDQAERALSIKDRLQLIREKRMDPDAIRELSEYQALGKQDSQFDSRKALAGGTLNHVETVAQIPRKDLENVLGVIHGYGGYQKFVDAVNSGRVKPSVAYHNAQATLAVVLRETQNAYHLAGTGADTDDRMKETQKALSPESFLSSPNYDVFEQRLNNVRAILQGVIKAPIPSDFGTRSGNTPGKAESVGEAKRVSGAPEVEGQVQRAPANSLAPPKPNSMAPRASKMSDDDLKKALGL